VAGGGDAPAVLAAIGTEVPDLIVADLRLANGQSGIVAIGELRRAFGHPTPALIVSGDTSDAAREETRAAGIAMLAKPVVAIALRNAADGIVTPPEREIPALSSDVTPSARNPDATSSADRHLPVG